MTLNEYAIKYLTDHGILPDHAADILGKAKAYPSLQPLRDRWGDSIEGYPLSVLAAICKVLDRNAIEWIDSNLPLAWYRPMFDVNYDKELGIR